MKKYFASNAVTVLFAYLFGMIISSLVATLVLNKIGISRYGIASSEVMTILTTKASELDSLKSTDINKYNFYLFHNAWSNFIQYFTMFILMSFYARRFFQEDIKNKMFNEKNKLINLRGIALIILFIGIMIGYHYLNAYLIELVIKGTETSINQSSIEAMIKGGYKIPLFISVVICAPIVEELVFRKCVFEFFKKSTRSYIPILISALLFSLPHMLATQSSFLVWFLLFVEYFMNGALLAYLYHYSKRNIYYPIALHFLNNLLAYIMIFLV